MKSYIILILVLILGYLFYDKFTAEKSVKAVYIKGEKQIVVIRDTVRIHKTISRTKLKIDTLFLPSNLISNQPNIRTSFDDSTSSYVLNLQAYAIAPVDSFKYQIKTFKDSVKTFQTDTLKTETTIETNKPNWYFVAGSFILGLILNK